MLMPKCAPLVVALAALLMTGCGSSAPSQPAFIKQADGICAKGDARFKSVRQPQVNGLPQQQILANLSTYVDQVLPLTQHIIDQLKGLGQPSANQGLLHRYFAALDQAEANLHQLSAAAKRNDLPAVQKGVQSLNANQPDQLAKQYGFKTCGGTGAAGR